MESLRADNSITLNLSREEASKLLFTADDIGDVYAEAASEDDGDSYLEGVSSFLRSLADTLVPFVTTTSDGHDADTAALILAEKLDLVVTRQYDDSYLVDGTSFSAEDILDEYDIHVEDLK